MKSPSLFYAQRQTAMMMTLTASARGEKKYAMVPGSDKCPGAEYAIRGWIGGTKWSIGLAQGPLNLHSPRIIDQKKGPPECMHFSTPSQSAFLGPLFSLHGWNTRYPSRVRLQ